MNEKYNLLTGNFIKQIRKSSGLTQKQMAEILYVTPQTISNWENGKRSISSEACVSFVKKFNINPQQREQMFNSITTENSVQFCNKCGNLFVKLGSNNPICCNNQTKPINSCTKTINDSTIFIKDNKIHVYLNNHGNIKYIAYITATCADVVKLESYAEKYARFSLRSGGELFAFIENKGLFKLKNNLI